ncbi:MAG: DNA ligase [Paraglaciecola polaris]|uniref:DNA ligase n=1 Tax=Paraglaciecola polaris TaxID=222814 RepID=UPI003002E354
MSRPLLVFYFCLASLLSLAAMSQTRPAIELANRYHEGIDINDYLVSEKLDGIRARWNGKQLLTRSGNTISAPQWFTRGFPIQALDGELWIARRHFEKTASVVLRQQPGETWHKVKFMLFDLPEYPGPFSERLRMLKELSIAANLSHLQVIPQQRYASQAALKAALDAIIKKGGEGLMLHHQNAQYLATRSDQVLKLKKHQDAEAVVLEHLPGKGKYLGMMGSVRVRMRNGKTFKIGSGFSDYERQHPPAIGSVVTFKYYDVTINGIPKFASYLRQKPEN